ncbi:hypothetical protein D9M71_765420 [compost metagenome]
MAPDLALGAFHHAEKVSQCGFGRNDQVGSARQQQTLVAIAQAGFNFPHDDLQGSTALLAQLV